jgi:hypothetical protein
MVQGFVMDNAHLYILVSQWIKGTPQKAKAAFGILPQPGVNPPKADDMISIGTFRCQSCGFLESYAREEFAVQ